MIIKNFIEDITKHAKSRGKKSAIVIQRANKFDVSSEKISPARDMGGILIGIALFKDADSAFAAAELASQKVDYVFFDVDWPKFNSSLRTQLKNLKRVFLYSDVSVWADSIALFASEILKTQKSPDVLVLGTDRLARTVIAKMLELGTCVYVENANSSVMEYFSTDFQGQIRVVSEGKPFPLVVGAQLGETVVGIEHSKFLGSYLLDGGIGSLSTEIISWAIDHGTNVLRVDNKAGLSGKVIALIETFEQVHHRMGRESVAGFQVVAGGAMGKFGDIVVDSIEGPSVVLGVADGQGRFCSVGPELQTNLEEFKKLLRTPLGSQV